MSDRIYIAIDLKSFYASVECVERNLNPLDVNLVVADESRTEKTICLAVTPALKSYGISGRARLFEVVKSVKEINSMRLSALNGQKFSGKSCSAEELKNNNTLELDYIIAVPRMALYIGYSTQIFDIYLKYVAPEDILVYSIDEVFIDATDYLKIYKLTAREFAMKLISDVFSATGITATAGIGTNMYLSKVAMDIVAKHIPADENGVRIAELDEYSYRRELWEHEPLTDFWRLGSGYNKKLRQHGMKTMGDIARCSLGGSDSYYNEDLLYRLFGINAELLIDHAWGYESCTMADIKSYKPESKSLSNGQVLKEPYTFEKARIVVMEMSDLLSLNLVRKKVLTNQLTLTIGYDAQSLIKEDIHYSGEVHLDHYGKAVPKHAHGTANLDIYCSSSKKITKAILALYDRIVDDELLIRRINICACNIVTEEQHKLNTAPDQVSLFFDYDSFYKKRKRENEELNREKRMQEALIYIKSRFGNNAVIKAMDLQEGATTIERNGQIGGHRA